MDPVYLNLPDPDETFKNGKGNCEACGKELAKSPDQIFLSIRYEPPTEILITCPDCETGTSYEIPLDQFLDNPYYWMSHLTEKSWLTPELALKFFKTMHKLQEVRLLKEG
jgi:hypothetical protein